MDDYSFLFSDIEVDYKKYHDSLRKKYPKIKESSEESLKVIESLKKLFNNKEDNEGIINFKNEMDKSISTLLKPLYQVIEFKYTKLYLSSLSLLKKFVIYNLIKSTEYSNIINYLKEIFFTNQNEDIQLKILEILQYIINGNIIKLNDININNIMSICKLDNIKGHVKYAECKNAIKLILNILAKKIFDITEEKNALQFIQNLFNSIDGNQSEWTTMTVQNSLIKGIKFELIISILETYPEKFIEGEPFKFLENLLNNFIPKMFQLNKDQFIGIKLCRLVLVIITIVNTNYLLIEEVLKYIDKSNQINWQKVLGLETLCELFKMAEILFDIYLNNFSLYKNIFQTFTNVVYNIIFLKSQKITDKKISSGTYKNAIHNNNKHSDNDLMIIPNKKYILNKNIYIKENGQNLNIITNIEYIIKLLTDCYIHLKNSYVYLMEKNNLNINISSMQTKNTNEGEKLVLNEKQEKIKEMINYNFIDFKGGLIGIFLHINDINSVQSFISIFQSFIYIYISFNLYSSRDELLNDLCKLALPNNLENVLEIKEKNILIIRAIFNLSHCTNLLGKNSWLIFIQTVQNLYYILIKSGYYLYNEKQQFDIDIIMKNIESNIKKYSIESSIMEVQKAVQEEELNKNINTITPINHGGYRNKEKTSKKSKGINNLQNIRILTAEEKENIDILSNVVNNLFSDSNDYDDNSLIDIINALYEDMEKKIIFFNKELKYIYDKSNMNSLNTENQRKNSLGEIPNKKEDNTQNKKYIGKLTVRNEMFKSTITPKLMNAFVGTVPGIVNFNVNFQNEKILINLSNINFNLIKIFGITIVNINRINILWDKICSIIKLFAFELFEENNHSKNIMKFIANLLGYILINILIKYNKTTKEEEKENIFNNNKIQTTLFTLFLNLLNGYYNNYYINPNYIVNPFKNIVEKCGTKLNIHGWNHLFEGFNLILRNKNNIINSQEKENLFKLIELIFSEYLDNLSIFNIDILIDVLEQFSINNENKNICYSSISFFWQCADIIDNYQKNKKVINGLELEIYNEKCSNDENKINFYENLWKKLFNKLIEINNDKRIDIKKSGINLFSQFFVAKMNSINSINNLSTNLINDIFFKIFNINIEAFLSDSSENNKNEIIDNNTELSNPEKKDTNNNNEEGDESQQNSKEEIVIFSLQSMGKVLKSFIELNKNNNLKSQQEIIHKLISIYLELLEKKNTPQITVNILKNIGEISSVNRLFFQENRDNFWKIIEKLINYINNQEQFINPYFKSVKATKVIHSIIESLSSNFYSKEDLEILNNKSSINNNIKSLLEIIQNLFNSSNNMEKTLINIDPFNVINTEKNIFNLIETIGSYCLNSNDIQNILNYLLKTINYNKEDKHCIAISGQCMKSLGVILSINNTLLNNLKEENIKNIVLECKEKINIFFDIKQNKSLVNELVIHNIKKKDIFVWENMIICFNDYILKFIIYKLKDEKTLDEIINFLVKIYNDVREENNNIINNQKENLLEKEKENENIIKEEKEELNNENVININNEKNNKMNNNNANKDTTQYKDEILKSNKNIEKNIINFIINVLLPNVGYLSKNIQKKLLKLLDINLDNNEQVDKNDDNDNTGIFSIKHMNLENLFNVCNFKGENEIKDEFNKFINDNNEEQINTINQYIEIKKNISKDFLPILFKTCKDKINKFLENEVKILEEKNIKQEMLLILDGLKNLDSYCNKLEIVKKNEMIRNCINNNKKGHLFILLHDLNKLIFSKDEEIKNKIYELFEIIANQIGPEE